MFQMWDPIRFADQSYPTLTHSDHQDVELVTALNLGGRNIPMATALNHVYADALGPGMTRPDLHRVMGDEKKPREISGWIDRSGPIGPLPLASQIGAFTNGAIWLKLNGPIRQDTNLNRVIWTLAEQIAKLSGVFELMPGGIIFSGTPENRGPLARGHVIDCHIDGLPNPGVKIV